MIASVLTLTHSDFKALKITDAYSIHRVIYSLFPKTDDGRDFLFVDKGGDFHERRILILSKRIPENPVYGTIETKNIPESFLSLDNYGFEIRLNPVKREKQSSKLVPIGFDKKGSEKKEALLDWVCNKSESWGFIIARESLLVKDADVQTFEKGQHEVTQSAVCFVGKLHVSDRSLFKKSFEEGIGRGKSFGFGLLQIMPLQKSE